jgi:D-amino-acid dehydrogenase
MADEAADVIVIGAGVIGLACAFRLSREGLRVLLLDRGEPGMGASFGNAGHIATEQVFPLPSRAVVRGALRYLLDSHSPLRIRPAYLLTLLPWLARFVWASRRSAFERGTAALASMLATAQVDLTDLLREAGAAHLLHRDGHLVLVENPEAAQSVQDESARLRAFGIDSDWLSPAEVKDIAPEITVPLAGATKFTGTGHVDDPQALNRALHRALLAAGGRLLQAEVTAIESAAGGFAASTSNGERVNAARVVVCCGAWSKPLAEQLGYPVPLDTERGYHITVPEVFPTFRIPIASHERKVIMTPMSMGLRMTGTVEFGGLRMPPDPKRFALLVDHLNALAANIPARDVTTWMGFRPSLPDHLPVLGRAPDGRNVFFAFGHQHLGLTLAGVTARIIAAQIAGRDTGIDMQPFAADRF